jgi:CheY-like chemotaxis protein
MSVSVLVVDDGAGVCRLLGEALPQYGFVVRLASSGVEAVQVYKEHGRAIDLVLLDTRLDGLDGPQTLALLRQIDPRVRCCLMTAFPGEYSGENLSDLGVLHVFEKPFLGLDELTQALGRLAWARHPPPSPGGGT